MSEEISSTVSLVQRAFPKELPSDALPIWRVLYEHMSHRQLALVISHFQGIDAAVALNTVYEVAQLELQAPAVETSRRRLEVAGLTSWMDE